MKLYHSITILIVLICSSSVLANFSLPQRISEWCDNYEFQYYPKDVALALLARVAITFIHELGHAAVGKFVLDARDITINLGSTDPDLEPYIKLPGFTINGFDLATGVCSCYTHPSKINSWQGIGFLLAGPLAGAMASFLLFKKMREIDSQCTKYPVITLIALLTTFRHLLSLVPGKKNDGAKIRDILNSWPSENG